MLSGPFPPLLARQPERTGSSKPTRSFTRHDRHGILIYSGKGSGDDAIVLDYDGVGGTNGTTLPFAGTLKCEEQLIQADTSSSRLTSMKQLGLSNRGTEEGTFQARCYNLDLVFAYLNGPARLSLIEINLTGR